MGSSCHRGINLFAQRDYDALVVTPTASPLLSIAESFLTGTEAGVTVYRQQSGSYLDGSFSISFGENSVPSVTYNASIYALRQILLSIPSISDDLSHRYLVTFIEPSRGGMWPF
jgi:hypothetical protein